MSRFQSFLFEGESLSVQPTSVSSRLPPLEETPSALPQIKYELQASIHESTVSDQPVLLDLAAALGLRAGDLAILWTPPSSGEKPRHLVFQVQPMEEGLKKRLGRLLISILGGALSSHLGISKMSNVVVRRAVAKKVHVNLMEVHIKDVHLTRGDMWVLAGHLVKSVSCCHVGQTLSTLGGISVVVARLHVRGSSVFSGAVDLQTKVVFRLKSAKLTMIVQLLEDMFHFDTSGAITHNRVLNQLLPSLLRKWSELGADHLITIILTTLIVDSDDEQLLLCRSGDVFKKAQDYFRVVVDQVTLTHWEQIMSGLRTEIRRFREEIGLIGRQLLPSVKGNLLRALDFCSAPVLKTTGALSSLKHTQSHFMVISPGTGLFDVDMYALEHVTKKLSRLDISVDLVCLGGPPPHAAPMFRYRDLLNKLVWRKPLWFNCFFWVNGAFINSFEVDNDPNLLKCKLYDLQMMGVMEYEMSGLEVPYLPPQGKFSFVKQYIEEYDKKVFTIGAGNTEEQISELLSNTDSKFHMRNLVGFIEKNGENQAELLGLSLISHKSKGKAEAKKDTSDNSLRKDQLSSATTPALLPTESTPHSAARAKGSPLVKLSTPTVMPSSPPSISEFSLLSDVRASKTTLNFTPRESTNVPAVSVTKVLSSTQANNAGGSVYSRLKESQRGWKESDTALFMTVFSNQSQKGSKESLPLPKPSLDFPASIKNLSEKLFGFNFGRKEEPELTLTKSVETAPVATARKARTSGNNDKKKHAAIRYAMKNERMKTLHDNANRQTTLATQTDTQKYTFNHRERVAPDHHRFLGLLLTEPMRVSDQKLAYASVSFGRWDNVYPTVEPKEQKNQGKGIFRSKGSLVVSSDATSSTKKRVKISWRSLICPAALPTTTCHFSNSVYKYVLGGHDVLPNSKFRHILGSRELFKEMVCARLMEGFQICEGDAVRAFELSRYNPLKDGSNVILLLGYLPDGYETEHINPVVYLATTDEVHRLFLDFYGNITVKILKKRGEPDLGVHRWNAHIRTRYERTYREVTFELPSAASANINWTKIDNYLAGNVDEKHADFKYGSEDRINLFQMRLVILPQSSNAAKAIRQFIEFIRKDEYKGGSKISKLFDDDEDDEEEFEEEEEVERYADEDSSHIVGRRKRSIIIDIDPNRRSHKSELIKIYYDDITLEEAGAFERDCFHIRLQWLTTTPKLIDDLVSKWSIACESQELRLVEVPPYEIYRTPEFDSFYSFVEVTFSLNPWDHPDWYSCGGKTFTKFYYHDYFLRQSGFVLDEANESMLYEDLEDLSTSREMMERPSVYSREYEEGFRYIQYIHWSGLYLAEVQLNGEFFLVPNNIYISKLSSRKLGSGKRDEERSKYSGGSAGKFMDTSSTEMGYGAKDNEDNLLDSQSVMVNFFQKCKNEEYLATLFAQARGELMRERTSEGDITSGNSGSNL